LLFNSWHGGLWDGQICRKCLPVVSLSFQGRGGTGTRRQGHRDQWEMKDRADNPSRKFTCKQRKRKRELKVGWMVRRNLFNKKKKKKQPDTSCL
jgi:hypothetical protein